MNDKLDTQLCNKYPQIFRDRHQDMQTTAMCWGFECGDGWYNLIDILCSQIQNHLDWKNKQRRIAIEYNKMKEELGKGNTLLWEEYSNAWPETRREKIKQQVLSDAPREVSKPLPQVVATQVKEKFGGLRFYYEGGDDVVNGMVSMAEALSYRTCEECGAPGKASTGGWIKTRCEIHTR